MTEAGFEVSEITQQSLLQRGHNLVPTTYLGTCQAVSIDIKTIALEAVSDVKKRWETSWILNLAVIFFGQTLKQVLTCLGC